MMRSIYFATTNRGKLLTFGNTMSKYGIKVVQADLEVPEIQANDVKPITREKVLHAYRRIGKPCVAMDTGLYIDSLNGLPGPMIKWWIEALGAKGMLKVLKGKSTECEFRQCIAYMDGKLKEPIYFQGIVRGKTVRSIRGVSKDFHWSEMFYIFVPAGERKTLAQMTKEEYYAWRDRSRAEKYEADFARFLLRRR